MGLYTQVCIIVLRIVQSMDSILHAYDTAQEKLEEFLRSNIQTKVFCQESDVHTPIFIHAVSTCSKNLLLPAGLIDSCLRIAVAKPVRWNDQLLDNHTHL